MIKILLVLLFSIRLFGVDQLNEEKLKLIVMGQMIADNNSIFLIIINDKRPIPEDILTRAINVVMLFK